MAKNLKEIFPNGSDDFLKKNSNLRIALPPDNVVMSENMSIQGLNANSDRVNALSGKIPFNKVQGKPKAHPHMDFLRQVVDLFQYHGWTVHAQLTAWTKKGYRTLVMGNVGFPDVFGVKENMIQGTAVAFAFELKIPPDKPSKEQLIWIELLKDAGIVARVVEPNDWDWLVKFASEGSEVKIEDKDE